MRRVQANSVSVVLDLRDADAAPVSPADFLNLWRKVAPQLVEAGTGAAETGVALKPGQVLDFKDRQIGRFSLTVMQLPQGFETVEARTPFAIQSVLQPLALGLGCRICERKGKPAHAPFRCRVCHHAAVSMPNAPSAGSESPSPQVCPDHVVILEGSLRSFCPDHAPRCDCDTPATAFCFGPLCKPQKGRAFCAAHVLPHPNVADVYYCHSCYETLFPRCGEPDCDAVATIRCSHLDVQSEQACGKTYCANHAKRWRVYGPDRTGLGRCVEHGELARLADHELVFQVVAGAVLENRQRQSAYRDGRLPTLQAVTHILMKPRQQRYQLPEIKQLFEDVRAKLDGSRPQQKKMIDLIDAHRTSREQDLARDLRDKQDGKQYFEKLVAELQRRGLHEIVAALSFADYRPQGRLLFVNLPSDLRGWLFGRGQRRELEAAIGVTIAFERGSE